MLGKMSAQLSARTPPPSPWMPMCFSLCYLLLKPRYGKAMEKMVFMPWFYLIEFLTV